MYTYLVIGNNWGRKIYQILIKLKKKALFKTISYTDQNLEKYLYRLNKIISSTKADIIWLAIPPKNQFEVLKIVIENNKIPIIEKPLFLEKKQIYKISNLLKKNKISNAVHFEFCYLKGISSKFKNIEHIDFDFHNINKNRYGVSSKFELGSHLMAIKLLFFSNVKNFNIRTSFRIKNLRNIKIISKYKTDKIDFLNNKENIIQMFINDFERHIKQQIKFKLDINFGYKVTNELKKI